MCLCPPHPSLFFFFFFLINTLFFICFSNRWFKKTLAAYCGYLITYFHSWIANLMLDFSDNFSIDFIWVCFNLVMVILPIWLYLMCICIYFKYTVFLIEGLALLSFHIGLKQTETNCLLRLSEVPVFWFLFTTVFPSFPSIDYAADWPRGWEQFID